MGTAALIASIETPPPESGTDADAQLRGVSEAVVPGDPDAPGIDINQLAAGSHADAAPTTDQLDARPLALRPSDTPPKCV